MKDQHELDKVDVAVVVDVVNPEHVTLHLVRVNTNQGGLKHLTEGFVTDLPVRVLRNEVTEGVLDLLPGHLAGGHKVVNVLLPEDRLPISGPHPCLMSENTARNGGSLSFTLIIQN